MNVKQQNLFKIVQSELFKKMDSICLTDETEKFFRLYLNLLTTSFTEGTNGLSKLVIEDELLFRFTGSKKVYSNFNFLAAAETANEFQMLFESFITLSRINDQQKRSYFSDYLIFKSGLSKEQLKVFLKNYGEDNFWLYHLILEKAQALDEKDILNNIFKSLTDILKDVGDKRSFPEYKEEYLVVSNCDTESLSVRFRMAVNLFQEFEGLENSLKGCLSFEELEKVSEPWFSKTLISLITKEKVWTNVLLDELCETMISKRSSLNG